MKKVVIVGILILALICGLSKVVKAAEDIIDIEDFGTIEDVTNNGQQTNNQQQPDTNQEPNTNQQPETNNTQPEANNTQNKNTTGTESDKPNPQTGIKEEAPIIILAIIGVGVAMYAGAKIKKYNY